MMSKLIAHSDRTVISQEMPPCHTLSLLLSLLPERVSGRVARKCTWTALRWMESERVCTKLERRVL